MMLTHKSAGPLCLALALGLGHPATALAADLSCNGLLESGQRLICSGFEPNWALELSCDGGMHSSFIDAFSGDGIQTTPGSITFLSENPWQLETSHPVTGTIAYTPGGCTDESDAVRDFTFTPTGAPNLPGPLFPFCCRMR
ncbi:hypothetical protein [Hoeflea ulvae]|uniref:Spore coat protein U domain-containing protein n=1 Tax=Hoeflea ulvae TaxID=2983764 RepID=A0ABT3YJJ7_9HYPH|nr:hypothetical protein [Hoeflea ulvae]MCY0096066.1 hypothetical protein [Hoeflea ulvae]